MNNEQLTVIARIKAKADKIEETKEMLLGLIGPTRQEAGCINYDLHVHQEDPSLFVFYENWTSKEALDKHLEMPYLVAAGERGEELLDEPVEITLWNPIG